LDASRRRVNVTGIPSSTSSPTGDDDLILVRRYGFLSAAPFPLWQNVLFVVGKGAVS